MSSHHVQCPWCYEFVEVVLSADQLHEFVEDCEVCCRPWIVQVVVGQTGAKRLVVERE